MLFVGSCMELQSVTVDATHCLIHNPFMIDNSHLFHNSQLFQASFIGRTHVFCESQTCTVRPSTYCWYVLLVCAGRFTHGSLANEQLT